MKSLKKEHIEITMAIRNEIESCYKHDKSSQSEITGLYFKIGKCISQQGEKAYISLLEKILTEKYTIIKGFSMRNLRRMRDFYLTYQNCPQLLSKALNLSWTQNTVILEYIETPADREFYIDLAIQKSLSKMALIVAIKGDIKCSDTENETVCYPAEPVCDFTGNCKTAGKILESAVDDDLSNQCDPEMEEERKNSTVRQFAKPVFYKKTIHSDAPTTTKQADVGKLTIGQQQCKLYSKEVMNHTLLAINLLPKIFNSTNA